MHQQNEKTAPSESRDIQETSGDHRSESEEELDGRHEVEDVLDQPAAHHDRPDGADEGDGEDLRDQDGPRRGRSADTTGRSSVTPSAKRKDQPESMDLITLSGLAQWTDRVLKKAGREYIEALLDISEVTGRLSVQRKETILTLVRLLEDRGSGNGLKAREMISMLAQLDGLLGNGTPADVRLLPLLLEDDPEVFRLTQR